MKKKRGDNFSYPIRNTTKDELEGSGTEIFKFYNKFLEKFLDEKIRKGNRDDS